MCNINMFKFLLWICLLFYMDVTSGQWYKPQTAVKIVGEKLRLNCTNISSAYPPGTTIWEVNTSLDNNWVKLSEGSVLETSHPWSNTGEVSIQDGHRLVINNTQLHHAGKYRCFFVGDPAGAPKYGAWVFVIDPSCNLDDESSLKTISVNEGDTVDLRCESGYALSDPAWGNNYWPQIMWFRGTAQLTEINYLANATTGQVSGTKAITMANSDVGEYRCQIVFKAPPTATYLDSYGVTYDESLPSAISQCTLELILGNGESRPGEQNPENNVGDEDIEGTTQQDTEVKSSGFSKLTIIPICVGSILLILILVAIVIVCHFKDKCKLLKPHKHLSDKSKSFPPIDKGQMYQPAQSNPYTTAPALFSVTSDSNKKHLESVVSSVTGEKYDYITYDDMRGSSLPDYEQIDPAFPVSHQHIQWFDRLGEGQFAEVWRVKLLHTGQQYDNRADLKAAKKAKVNDKETSMNDLKRELELMKIIPPHPYVVGLAAYTEPPEDPLIITDLMYKDNLKEHLRFLRGSDNQNIFSNGNTLLTMARDCADGIAHLHSVGVVHCDIAARNVLLQWRQDGGLVCKISDFGLARKMGPDEIYQQLTQGLMPLRWMAPEALKTKTFTPKTDVWSLGILIWEITTFGATPYPQLRTSKEVIQYVNEGRVMETPKQCSKSMYNLMKECWTFEPDMRPPASTLSGQLQAMITNDYVYVNLDDYEDYDYLDPVILDPQERL